MKLGWIAIGHRGGIYQLEDLSKSPRAQLLAKLDRKHAERVFRDSKEGRAKHIGYIVAGEWFTIFEIHEWQGKESGWGRLDDGQHILPLKEPQGSKEVL